MKGRKNKPTNVHLLHGTLRKDRMNLNEPQIAVADDLKPPEWFDEEQRKHWRYYFRVLKAMNVITEADHAMLVAFVCAVARLREAERLIDRDGLTVDGQFGPKTNPATTIAAECAKQIKALGGELGLSPTARPRINVVVEDDPKMAEAARRLIKP